MDWPRAPQRTRPLVLLVEDSTTQARATVQALESAGFRVRMAQDGLDALEQARTVYPDVIVSDVLMPHMDGFALCRQVRHDPTLARVPVLLYTVTFTDPKDEEFARAIGANRWLVKTDNPYDLVQEILDTLVEDRSPTAPDAAGVDDPFLQAYGERLIAKLESKISELAATNHDLERSVAAYVAELAERKRVEMRLRNHERQQVAVTRLSNLALQGTNLDALVREAADMVACILNVRFTKVLEYLPDQQVLRLCAGFGWRPGLVGEATVDGSDKSQAGYTLQSREPVIVADQRRETRFEPASLLVDHGVVSGVSVVIHGRNYPYGVLGAHTDQTREFTDDDINFIQAVANVIALANERRRADEERSRVVAEQAARVEAEAYAARLRALFDALVDAVCIVDAAGRLVDANPSFLSITGIQHHELGQPFVQCLESHCTFYHLNGESIHPDDTAIARASRGETVSDYEARLRTKREEERLVSISATPVRDEDGNLSLIIAVVHDLTERWNLQARREALGRVAFALVQEQTLARAAEVIVEQAQAVLDCEGVLLWRFEREHKALHLLAFRGLSDRSVGDVATIPLDAPLAAAVAARSGKPVEVEDLHLLGPELAVGRAFVRDEGMRSLCAQPLFARGNLVGAMTVLTNTPHRFSSRERELMHEFASLSAIIVDNAETLQQTVQRAEISEEARTEMQRFLGMVAHDLAQPLTIMTAYSTMLQRSLSGNAADREEQMARAMLNAARQMRRLVDDLRDAARAGAGQFEIRPFPGDVVEIARSVVDEASLTATKHCLRLDTPESIQGVWDQQRLQQLLTNLVTNAIKYSPHGGEVRVTLGQVDDDLVISVSDQGNGMTPEETSRLFRPFARLDRDRYSGIKGMGLGLYLCRVITEGHGGQIWVESAPGQGSTFHVRLPRIAGSAIHP